MSDVDGWSYEGVTSAHIGPDPLRVHTVHAVQKREVSGGGDYLHRRVTLREEKRIGPAGGGSPDHRELEGEPTFAPVGIVTSHRDGPLTETAGVALAEVGFQVADPMWYWVPVKHEAEPPVTADVFTDLAEAECTCTGEDACHICGGDS